MKKALIVEDDKHTAAFLRRALEKEFKYEVVWGENGKAGIEKLKHFSPDIVLLDIAMPIMNGVDFLKAFRGIKGYEDTPVIILSANSEKEIVAELIQLKICDYILKPLVYERTCLRLQSILSKVFS